MNQSNINNNKLKQSSSSNSTSITLSSCSTDINNQSCLTNGSTNVQQTLDNRQINSQIFDQNTSNKVSFEDLFGDIDLNQLSFQEVYAQTHCMNSPPTQLTQQQHEEIITKVSPNVDNILRKFFNKSLKLEEPEKLSESTN